MGGVGLAEFLGTFGDPIVSSTDLNRRSGSVLDQARDRPVTISRNGELFALLRRDLAADLVRTALRFGPTLAMIEGALNVAEGKEPSASMAWLKAFDRSDLRKLIRDFLAASIVATGETGKWEEVDAVIHEWHESALLAMSGIFEEVHGSTREEVPLTDPNTIGREPKVVD
ncbi:MAG: type II toxin-antitoxin system prevent-host-death family antitoxin [Bryobacteraceae bacterium]